MKVGFQPDHFLRERDSASTCVCVHHLTVDRNRLHAILVYYGKSVVNVDFAIIEGVTYCNVLYLSVPVLCLFLVFYDLLINN